jgi:hypothetical protein
LEFRLPAKSLSALESELEDAEHPGSRALKDELAADGRLGSTALQSSAQRKLKRDLDFEVIRSGIAVEGAVAWFSGWVPAKEAKSPGSAYAAKAGWALILDEPKDEELPPTKSRE